MEKKKTSVKASRKFVSQWDEIMYLYYKILHWFYGSKHSRARARPFALRLERLLQATPGSRRAIKAQECWSLVYEVKNDLPNAIKHRNNEVRLWKKLFSLPESRRLALEYSSSFGDQSNLTDALITLGWLYENVGDRKRALKSHNEARAIAGKHGFHLEPTSLLPESAELTEIAARSATRSRSSGLVRPIVTGKRAAERGV